jgi:hypothetical protein
VTRQSGYFPCGSSSGSQRSVLGNHSTSATVTSRTPRSLFQDGHVGVRVFPQHEEVLIGSLCLGRISGDGIAAAQSQVGQRTDRLIPNQSGVVEDLLKLGCRLRPWRAGKAWPRK